MKRGTLPRTVDAQCGTINLTDNPVPTKRAGTQASAKTNVDGTQCDHSATRFVKSDNDEIEMLVCGRHEQLAQERIETVTDD